MARLAGRDPGWSGRWAPPVDTRQRNRTGDTGCVNSITTCRDAKAARSEPVPLSFVLLTVIVAAFTVVQRQMQLTLLLSGSVSWGPLAMAPAAHDSSGRRICRAADIRVIVVMIPLPPINICAPRFVKPFVE